MERNPLGGPSPVWSQTPRVSQCRVPAAAHACAHYRYLLYTWHGCGGWGYGR